MNKVGIKFLLLAIAAYMQVSMATAQTLNDIFSASFAKGIPVHITNNRDKGFAIKTDINGNAVTSRNASYTTDEIWYLVGNADGFKLFYHELGERFAVNIERFIAKLG